MEMKQLLIIMVTLKKANDAAVQTSRTLVTTSSIANASGENDLSSQHSGSFNSHGTTMQTNCYGSIVGNFGSIIIQQKSISIVSGLLFLLR